MGRSSNDVYVQSFPGPGRPLRISREGGKWPEWSKDGRGIYFIAPDLVRGCTSSMIEGEVTP